MWLCTAAPLHTQTARWRFGSCIPHATAPLPADKPSDSGLSAGAIAGIAVGATAAAGACLRLAAAQSWFEMP